MDVKNKFILGDSLELMTPTGNIQFTLDALFNKNNSRQMLLRVTAMVYLPVPDDVDLNFALLIRNLPGTTISQPHKIDAVEVK